MPGTNIPLADGPSEADQAMDLLIANTRDYHAHPLVLIRDRGLDALRGRTDFRNLISKMEAYSDYRPQ